MTETMTGLADFVETNVKYPDVSYEDSSPLFLKRIEGKTITHIGVSQDGEFLIILFNDETGQLVGTEGDCCSQTYFYEVTGARDALEAGKVTGIRRLDAGDAFQDEQRDYVQSYGFAIDTESGSIRVIFRNDSNGYYGGWAFETSPEKISVDPIFDFVFTNDWTA